MKSTASIILLLSVFACSQVRQVPHDPVSVGDSRVDPAPPVLHAADVPPEAKELLAESEADSCSICAREKRERAFRILEERFPPGAIVASDDDNLFRVLPGGENELFLGDGAADHPLLVYRFHTASTHLVGIAPEDLTDPSTASVLLAAPEDAAFRGMLRVIPYEYGDGPSFLHSAAKGRVVVMCRILAMDEE